MLTESKKNDSRGYILDSSILWLLTKNLNSSMQGPFQKAKRIRKATMEEQKLKTYVRTSGYKSFLMYSHRTSVLYWGRKQEGSTERGACLSASFWGYLSQKLTDVKKRTEGKQWCG